MLTQDDLPAIQDTASPPAFCDSGGCRQWLKALPLTNIQTVQGELSEQLARLGHYPLAALERLKILEQLRETVTFVAGELGKRYRNKSVPFQPLEQTSWEAEQALWHALELGYRQCLQAIVEGNAEIGAFAALVAQRAMSCIVSRMLAYGHAYRAPPPALWKRLHALFAFAETRGVAAKRIKDASNREDGIGSCEATYAKALLLHLADIHQLTSRQLLQLDRWLDKWAPRAPLDKEQPPTPSLALIAVDLAGDSGALLYSGQPLQQGRFLDSEQIALSLRKRIKFLRKGGNPAEIGLGEDCVMPGCEVLLSALYQRWCDAPPPRAHARLGASGLAHVCFAFPAIYFFLKDGTPFKQPGETHDVPPEVVRDMHMFGRVTERTEKLLLTRLGHNLESWNILDQSVGGFRLSRQGPGERVSQNQLATVRPPTDNHFILAVVRWLVVDESGDVSVGVRALPGIPTAVAARQLSLNQLNASPFSPAFKLSELPALQEPASLVLPIGWFQPGKRVQLYDDMAYTVKLVSLLEKGSNFDRVSYVPDESF